MSGHHITVESAYTQQSYLIRLCMGCTIRKMQAENWHHRADQLEVANRTLHNRVIALRGHVNWYRAKCRELKEENDLLRSKLERYAELEKALSEWRG